MGGRYAWRKAAIYSLACEGAMSALRAPPTRAQGAGGRPEAGICPWAALGAAEAAEGVPGGIWAVLEGLSSPVGSPQSTTALRDDLVSQASRP